MGGYLRRARDKDVTWDSAQNLSDAELEQKLFVVPSRNLPVDRVPLDLLWVQRYEPMGGAA